ncbi:Aminopeptidase N [Pseudolycoriella hygida]|uniref:Aminopeptidase n=1 Tax=Pseudolycoriella hygida TaxID=35572 RepID=A0A9Q0MQJ2_9DIPT|nr:Aminopeptidase N [Pseudolycoriella hygida]
MWWKVLFLLFGVAGIIADVSARIDEQMPPWMDSVDDDYYNSLSYLSYFSDGISYRLPNTTVPISYDIWISTDIHRGEFGFDGEVTVRFECIETTPELILQYRAMTIDTVALFDENNSLIEEDVSWYQNETVEFLIITPSQQLIQGQEYLVNVKYNGSIRDDGLGIYSASYITPEGERRWLASTQFQATDARRAFPCYDEPLYRTRFNISIRHHSNYTALSNMNAVEVVPEPESDYVLTKFAETLKIQSYLVAFTVSDFISTDNLTAVPPQRVFGKSASIRNGEGEMALETSIRQMKIMEEYFGIDYRFPKMDHFACPNFSFVGMENSGLVLYDELFLLWDPVSDRTSDRDNVITLIAHELIHQWFGNLVSPVFWNYLWINEGFAALYEFYIPHMMYPEARYMDFFIIKYMHVALKNDGNLNIRAMTHYVENPDQIEALADGVAYDKAGSVLHMMQNALGHETWRRGLQYFLNARQDNYTNSAFLYAGIQLAVSEDIKNNTPDVHAIMSTWELQAGVPIVTVSRSGDVLNLQQTRFFYSNQSRASLWQIPINYVVRSNPNFNETTPDLWFAGKELEIRNGTAPKPWMPNDWIVVNVQQSGYYRVNYDTELWSLLIEQLNSPEYHLIHLLNRGQLIDDSFNIARSGRITPDIPLDVMNYLERETDHIPWDSAQRALFLYNRWLLGTPVYDEFQDYVLKNVAAMYNKLGVNVIENEPRLDRYARQIAINLACLHGSAQCLDDTAEQLENFFNLQKTLHPDVVAQIYCNGIRRSGADVVEKMQNLLLKAKRQIERDRIIAGLGCIEDPDILYEHLLMAIQPGELSSAERSNVLTLPLDNGIASLRALMNFIRSNYGGINLVSADLVSTLCSNIAIRISTKEMYDTFVKLLSHLKINGAISASKETKLQPYAKGILNWQEKHMEHVVLFFEKKTNVREPFSN